MDLLWKVLLFTVPFTFFYECVWEVYYARYKFKFYGTFSEGLSLMLTDKKFYIEFFRMLAVYTILGFVLMILIRADTNWIWYIVWPIGGYISLILCSGWATAPFYIWAGLGLGAKYQMYDEQIEPLSFLNKSLTDIPESNVETEDDVEEHLNDYGAYYQRGYAYSKSEQHYKAIHYYTKAIELDPGSAETYNNRGYCYYRLEQYEEALKDYDKTLEIDPNQQYAINNRRILLEEHPELKP